MGFNVKANEINKFANYLLLDVHDNIRAIKWGIRQEALSLDGVDGKIRDAIEPFTSGVEALVDQLFEKGLVGRLDNLAETLKVVCRGYGEVDQGEERRFEKLDEKRQHGDKMPTGNKRFPRM